MKAKITIGWEPSLSKNNAYILGDMKLGRTEECKKAMWDIVMLMRPAVGYDWKWNGNRIQVTITAYRPSNKFDAQNLVDSVSDAIEETLRLNDREFDIAAIGKLDRDNPRIEIELSQETP